MQKAYSRIIWENEPSTQTPLSESNLNRMDYALDQVDTRVVELAGYQTRAETAAAEAEEAQRLAEEAASAAASGASDAQDYSTLSKSYAIGNTGERSGENTDNSKYYSEQAAAHKNTAYTYLGQITSEATNAIAQIQDALGDNVPSWTVNLTDGHAYYTGGSFGFEISSAGHLMWEVA